MTKKLNKSGAKLRVCGHCMWIFKNGVGCPKCEFASYSAVFVFGRKAYYLAKTQKPWRDEKLARYAIALGEEIAESQKLTPPTSSL
jgi:hypothetical protein